MLSWQPSKKMLKNNYIAKSNKYFTYTTLYFGVRSSFRWSGVYRRKGGLYSSPYRHVFSPSLSHSPSLTPKFLHNNWTWRQRLEYEIRERDEEPKAEDRKRIQMKIKWRVGEEERKKFPALSDRSRVDRMLVYSVLQEKSHLISNPQTAAQVTITMSEERIHTSLKQ